MRAASVSLLAGTVTALIGPNGSGKSTLLRALARLHPPVAGSVTFADGADLRALSGKDIAKRITLLSQHRTAPGGVSVRELVEFGRHPHRSRWGGRDPDGPAAVERALALTGLTALADRPVQALSGGQAQRVWLASCLAQDTALLLLDEPTTFLDLRYQVEILDVVRDLADRHGVGVGVVLHDLDQAAAVADRVLLLEDGRVTADGSPADVLTSANLSRAYGIRVDVAADPADGRIHTRAIGRFNATTPGRSNDTAPV
ncbi:ABC transporter ATP-binding protein [Amycolatopsis sp. NPDC049691]|uniref:ABC transporter ATP-binding protein n=1 Tax=Amycolatopsis sp. NPDC049691 TaxID=3155155 RepID=UPI0034484C27